MIVQTTRPVQALDITNQVILKAPELPDLGLLWAAVPHTTAALLMSEVDADLLVDLERFAAIWLIPFEPFTHHKNDNPNAAAHLTSALAGTQLLLPIRGGEVSLGRYQRIVLLELDGPKDRTVELAPVAIAARVGLDREVGA
ncbi:MAG: YjbQ family protein [Candidatus Dormibacteraeota bacterium]|nr:YjbQ family protein [Candidatus Dormibacteraeota bacterium]